MDDTVTLALSLRDVCRERRFVDHSAASGDPLELAELAVERQSGLAFPNFV